MPRGGVLRILAPARSTRSRFLSRCGVEPPYLTVKDRSLSTLYHDAYVSCRGKYALTAPFTERAFELAAAGRNSGYVGLLMANSFMKREFGRPLVEHVLSRVDVSRIIDTSGAYLPGHGTPTVVLTGRNHEPDPKVPVYLVVGKEGEPALPEVPSHGLVWQSLRAMSDRSVATENRWTRSFFQQRSELAHFPWSLTDPTSRDLLRRMEQGKGSVNALPGSATKRLRDPMTSSALRSSHSNGPGPSRKPVYRS
ncbi:Eco57I restriction-modification methylase domain-containing protein [Streptomyces sanglieri]|uniref:site-specific DNA-methyltransferase (adenine-specific) n=1 Tax=Streptomyces sanglieri TaxID=193460 RepID=A0ABW2WYT8_9ACTN